MNDIQPIPEDVAPGNGDQIPQDGPGGKGALFQLLSAITPRRQIVLELTLLGLWALIVGNPYLNFEPSVIPAGREFGSAIQTHSVWTLFRTCGWCALWNGFGQGGYPAFVDTHGSMPHPLVMIPTLTWGVINGAKISLVIAFWIAGVAQWWLARELKVGWLPRIWSALMVMVAGHLAGRMEMGVFAVFFSTAMTSLVFGALFRASRGGGPRATVLLAVVLASTLVSGQGYLQIGLVLILPASLILLFDGEDWSGPGWRAYLLGGGLGILLAAYFLLPLAHFLPNFAKDMDAAFNSAQPLPYIPLNLVISDPDFYRSEVLDKLSFPYLYTLFIGWAPVILAVIGFGMAKREDRRTLWFLLSACLLAFIAASALPLRWIVDFFPALAGIRQPSLFAGLAVPPILALSAYGLDRILQLEWPTLSLKLPARPAVSQLAFSLRWLLLIPLALSLYQGYLFTRHWVYTDTIDVGVFQLIEELHTDTAQWVNPPFGDHYYLAAAADTGLKISPGIRPWHWKGRQNPIPSLEADRRGQPAGTDKIGMVDQVGIYQHPQEFYAAISVDGRQQPCSASSTGGKITVICDSERAGILEVKENMWSGWKAWMDEERVPLVGEDWLAVPAAAGRHTYQFRYRPWDFPLGLALSLASLMTCIWLWFDKNPWGTSRKP